MQDKEWLGRIAELMKAHDRNVVVEGRACTVGSWNALRYELARLIVVLGEKA